MTDIEQRWLKLPDIDIERGRILTVNGKIVEIPDVSPRMLGDYIELGKGSIDSKLYVERKLRRNKDVPFINPAILVGRLAVVESESDLFTQEGRGVTSAEHIRKDDLVDDYHDFWDSIEAKLYKPVVYRNVLTNDINYAGTWLALRRRTDKNP